MKLEKAIEILVKWKAECSYDNTEELDEAEQLGIEALKRLAFNRLNTIASSDELLLGETTE